MPKINVYLPDELAEAVKDTGVPVSTVCQHALEQAVRRVNAIRATTLAELGDDDLAARLPHFTGRARTALTLGIAQARDAAAATVGSGHLLGGLLAEGSNLALRVLRTVEVEPEQVSRSLDRQPLNEPGGGPDGGARHFSAPAANALELAVAEATASGHNYIGCEHLLLGLIAEPDGDAGQVLRSLGADLRLTRRAVAAALAGYLHLRAQTTGAGTATDEPATTAVATALRQELQPLLRRIQRLEEQAGMATGD